MNGHGGLSSAEILSCEKVQPESGQIRKSINYLYSVFKGVLLSLGITVELPV